MKIVIAIVIAMLKDTLIYMEYVLVKIVNVKKKEVVVDESNECEACQ